MMAYMASSDDDAYLFDYLLAYFYACLTSFAFTHFSRLRIDNR